MRLRCRLFFVIHTDGVGHAAARHHPKADETPQRVTENVFKVMQLRPQTTNTGDEQQTATTPQMPHAWTATGAPATGRGAHTASEGSHGRSGLGQQTAQTVIFECRHARL